MRFLVGTSTSHLTPHVFVVNGQDAIDLTSLDFSFGHDLTGLMRRYHLAQPILDATIPLADITPALPVANPGKIVCLGLNYIDHIKEGGYADPGYPALFMRCLDSMMPAGAPMIRPTCSEQLD